LEQQSKTDCQQDIRKKIEEKSVAAPRKSRGPTINIAAALHEIGTLLELKGGRYFQARAYKNAAQVLSQLDSSLAALIEEDRLKTIKGIGGAIAAQVRELHSTGSSHLLAQLRAELPRGALELATVPGLTLSKIKVLQDALGITNVAELKKACENGLVRTVKGFGAKTEQKLLEGISQPKKPRKETHIHKALQLAEELISYLKLSPGAKRIEIGGPLRRWCETTPDLTLVVAATDRNAVLDHFAGCPLLVRIVERTNNSFVAILNTGLKVTLFVSALKDWGSALVNVTGSPAHLQRLDEIARVRNLSLNLQGGTSYNGNSPRASKNITFSSESALYDRLEIQYVPPELREDQGEIEAALAGELPEDFITLGDIRGMLHCHTNYSDGKHTIAEMAQGADALGMSYLTITDHSPTAFYAGGLKIDRLKRQWDEINRVQEIVNVKLLRGTESDILADGSLDYPDRILEQFDVIIASIHSRYRMDEDQMTERVTRAMKQPWFKIWGHALGRLIQHRPPFNARVQEILDVIAESKVAIEINGDPYRLDMEARWVREARKRHLKFVISTDAHSINGMKNLKFGVGIARRGWVRRGEVLNTLETDSFMKAVKPSQ
jgi:DNA polymerase (family X)